MSLKLSLFLISTFVLLQLAVGRPNTDTAATIETATNFTDFQNTKRTQLFVFTGDAYFRRLYSYLRRVKLIFQSAVEKNLKDNVLSKEAIDEFNKYINLIETSQTEEMEKCSVDLRKKYNLRQEVLQVIAKYESYDINVQLSQLKSDFNSELGAFLEEFKTRSYAFWNQLSVEEKAAEIKFKTWCEQLVAEQDREKKLPMFLNLFDMYSYKYRVRCM